MATKTTTSPETITGPRLDRSGPFYLLAVVGLSVFLAEALVMALLILLPLPRLVELALDSALLTLLTLPALYRFVFRPIQRQITQRKQVEAELQQAQAELEQRVTSRTHELAQANMALQAEISERKKAEGELRLALEEARSRQAESKLRAAHDELETRVQERTQELEDALYDLREENIERKRAEEQSQIQIAALEAAANGIIITDIHARIQWCNPAFTEMTGYSLDEILGKPMNFLKSGEHPAEFYDELWSTILAGQVWQGEVINRRKNGSLYTEEQTITPVLNDNGKTTHYVAIKQDITERRMVTEALEMERQRLFALLEQLPANVLLLAPDHSIQFANGQFRERFGDTETKDCYESMHDLLFPCENCPPFEVFKTKKPVVWEQDLPDGVSYQIYNYPFIDVNGDLLVLYLGIDITARKQAERMLESSNRELRALSIREHNQRLLAEGLAESAFALNTSLDLNAVFDRILEGIQHVIPCRAAFISLFEGDEITVARRRGFSDILDAPDSAGEKYSLTDFPFFKQIAGSLRPVLVPDTRNHPNWRSLPGMEWSSSFAAIPFTGREGMIGFIGLLSDQLNFFGEEIIGWLLAFAAQAVVAIQNARSYEAEQRARQTAETLRAASIALTQSLDLDTVLGALLDYLVQLVPYDFAVIMLLEDETHLAVRVMRGAENSPELLSTIGMVIDTSSSARAHTILQERRSVILSDTRDASDWPTEHGLAQIRSWIAVPLVARERVIGLCGLGKMSPGFFTEEHIRWTEALTSQSTVAIQNAWLFEQVRAGRERLQSLSRRLVDIQEAERHYVARELHDEAGQALASLMVGLRLLERDAGQPEAVIAGLGELKSTVDGVLENLHRLAMDLRPASLDHLGLVAALRQHVETMGEKHGLLFEFETVGLGAERLPVDVETALYRIVQEALTNVIRHSGASRADVLLERRAGCLVVVIEDNGVGFDVDAQALSNRLGLYGMRERAEMLGGQLVIESAPGAGTTIFVEVPYVGFENTG